MFYLSCDHNVEVSRDFVSGVLSTQATTLLSLGSIGLMELKIMVFVISVPIPFPIPIPMPRFTNGLFIVYNSVPFLEFLFFKIFSYNLWFFFDEFNMPHCKGLKTFLKIHCTHYLRIFFKHVHSQQ